MATMEQLVIEIRELKTMVEEQNNELTQIRELKTMVEEQNNELTQIRTLFLDLTQVPPTL